MSDIQSLLHWKWRCQYHIVFAPKYRRKEVYGRLKVYVRQSEHRTNIKKAV